MKVTLLGSGASMGTPAAGGFWGDCDPQEPRNTRNRASLLVQSDTTNILIDTSYDLRHQLNRTNTKKLDGVFITHSHNDHVNGIDDLRFISYHNKKLLDLYSNQETLDELDRIWPFIFVPSQNIYTEFLKKKPILNYEHFTVGDINVQSFAQDHTVCTSLGFRFGDFAYSVDVARLDARALDVLKGVKTWVVDGGAYHNDIVKTHANFKSVLEWVDILKPEMTYITVLSPKMDYKTMCNELPANVRPAYDGLEIEFNN